MATTNKMEPTKYPGVFRLESGRFAVQVGIKLNGLQKKARKVMPAGTTIAAAVAEGERLKEELRNPPPPILSPLQTGGTLEEYAAAWLEQKGKLLKPSAIGSLKNAINGFVVPRMGWMQCVDVNRAAVQSWVAWAQDLRSPRDGRAYAHDTMKTWWRGLALMLRDMAADLGLQDPTVRVTPPCRNGQEPMREQRTLNQDEVGVLLGHARDLTPDRYAEIACLALTGMRAGELYALAWEHVDLTAGQVVVRRSVSLGKLTETTKTKARRTVPLHPLLVEVLRAHRGAQFTAQNRAALASGLVFPSPRGTPRTANSLDKAFEAIAAAMKSSLNLGAQVLRRSLNTNLVQAQVDRLTVRAILGHSSEQMTQRYYGVAQSDKADALAKVVRIGPET